MNSVSVLVSAVIVIPFSVVLFRQIMGNTVDEAMKEIRKTKGSEWKKLIHGDFLRALEGEFVEFKPGIWVVLTVHCL